MTSHLLLLPIVLMMAVLNELDAWFTYRRGHVLPRAHFVTAGLTCASVGWWLVAPLVLSGQVMNWAAVAGLLLLFVPTRLIVRVVGREPKWQLYALLWEAVRLDRTSRKPRTDADIARMGKIVARIDGCRTPETNELCDLLIEDYKAWMAGVFAPLYMAARTIRVHEIEVELYGALARKRELDPDEATFRWRLWRTFGGLIQAGAAEQTEAERALFERFIAELDAYRRSDTIAFIDALQKSTRAWLAGDHAGPWPPEAGIQALGPAIELEYDRLFPRTSVFWGARTDETDDRLAEDLMVTARS
jgi:hypothetical protein